VRFWRNFQIDVILHGCVRHDRLCCRWTLQFYNRSMVFKFWLSFAKEINRVIKWRRNRFVVIGLGNPIILTALGKFVNQNIG
jgi:hypothetical protein